MISQLTCSRCGTEEQTLRVFPDEAAAVACCEALDVEAAIWLFCDNAGIPLEPEFITPNKRAALLEALEHIMTVEGPDHMSSISAVREHLTEVP